MEMEQWLGRYLVSLSPLEQAQCGRRVKVIAAFIESGLPLSREGYYEYLKIHGMGLTHVQRGYLCDYLYFAGVRVGGKRKAKGRIVKRLESMTEANKRKITAFLDWVKSQYDYSQASIRMKRDHMVMFFRYFTEFNLANCRDFISTQEQEGKHPKTLNLYIITLKQYGEFVKKKVTLKKISIPQTLSTENVPTEKEYQNFLGWLKDNNDWQMYWIIKVLGSTGMRRSELDQVTWQDILSGEFFPMCKGKKKRMIFFPKAIVHELKEWLKTNAVDTSEYLVLSTKTGAKLSDRGLAERLKDRALKAGFPKAKAHCHAFRHFFAKQFLKRTKDVVQLAELLGHESVDTTRLYLQRSKAEQIREINRHVTW